MLAWASLWQGWLSAWWMAAPAAAFAVLVVVHDRVIRDLRTAARRESFAAEPLRRLAAEIDAGAGDPARAARRLGRPVRMHDWRRNLVFAPLAIGATLRVQDSLLAGRSRFYAEITRVRRLVEMAEGPAPLLFLFLFDEMFHGTNSHGRVEGAHGVLRRLAGLRAVGLEVAQ